MTHLIDNNEMDPHTECGLALIGEFGQTDIQIVKYAIGEMPTCPECLKKEAEGAYDMTQAINTIKISGKTYFGCDNPEEYMKDMLRYDGGVIFNLDVTDEATHAFEATIVASGYTPERWMTFGLYPTLINGTAKAWNAEHQITHLK